MSKVILTAGLGYGDEGKGSFCDFLVEKHNAKLVVRYNGGAQAAHNVVRNGKHHMFSQFGSGTLAGARTFLSRFMVVNPIFMEAEAKHLKEIGVSNPMSLLTIERDAAITTPFHVASNRLKEIHRLGPKDGRHGSCGMGVGETRRLQVRGGDPLLTLTVGDLANSKLTWEKLNTIRRTLREETSQIRRDLNGNEAAEREADILLDGIEVDAIERRYSRWLRSVHVADSGWLHDYLRRDETVVFEGAQGMLLDEKWGFFPYTTWTDITFANANTLLDGYTGETQRLGLCRSYMTKHGAGPFVTENTAFDRWSENDHNRFGPWQGSFRNGPLDIVALRYAIAAMGGVDGLVMTHLDRIPGRAFVTQFYRYAGNARGLFRRANDEEISDILVHRPCDLDHQQRITQAFDECAPASDLYDKVRFFDSIPEMIGAPLVAVSEGQTADAKRYVQS